MTVDGGGGGSTEVEVIAKSEYMRVHALMYKCLHPHYNHHHAMTAAQRDWTRDIWLSRSPHALDLPAYMSSLFELVDIWTLTVEKEEYVHFLAVLFHRITRLRTWMQYDGSVVSKYVWRRWRWVNSSSCYRPYAYGKYSVVRWKRWADVMGQLDEEDEVDVRERGEEEEEEDESAEEWTDSDVSSTDLSSSTSPSASDDEQPSPPSTDLSPHLLPSNAPLAAPDTPDLNSAPAFRAVATPSRPSTSASASEHDSSGESDDDSDDNSEPATPASPLAAGESSRGGAEGVESELDRAKRQLSEIEAAKSEIRERLKKERKERQQQLRDAMPAVNINPPDSALLGTIDTSNAVAVNGSSEGDDDGDAADEGEEGESRRIKRLREQLDVAAGILHKRREEKEREMMEALKRVMDSGVKHDSTVSEGEGEGGRRSSTGGWRRRGGGGGPWRVYSTHCTPTLLPRVHRPLRRLVH